MAANHVHHLDKNLNDCHEHDIDWTLLPQSIRQACKLLAKGMKQRDTSILFGILILLSFCMGHACVNVHAFWTEPVILWVACAITTGIFSRGKSHILRLAVPIQLLLTEFDTDQNNQATDDSDNTVSDYTPNIEEATLSGESTEETTNTESDMENSDIDASISEDTTETDQVVPITIRQQNPQITGQAIKIAHSLVDTCLSQLCTLNDKTHILNPKGIEETESQPEFPLAMKKILHQIISSPGEIVSFSELNKRGVFKKTIEQMHGKRLMEHVADEMDKLQLGQIHRFTVAGNSCQVYFLCKPPIPENMDEAWEFSKKLSSVGMSIPKYKEYYNVANEESKKHLDDYNNRKDTPVKQARKKLCLSSTQAI